MGGAQANPTTPVVKRGVGGCPRGEWRNGRGTSKPYYPGSEKGGWVGVTQREGHVRGGGGGIPPTWDNRIEGRRGQRGLNADVLALPLSYPRSIPRGLNPSPWDGQRRVEGFEPGTVRHDGRRWPIGLHIVVLKHHCFH